MKKVLIVGCGAIGSLCAAHLAKGGEVEVYAFDASQPHVDAINQRGLRLSGASDVHVRLAKASTDPAELPICDYGIVATKAIHTAAAIKAAARCFDEGSAVCSVQNGVGNEEIIAEHVKYVLRGTTFPAGHMVKGRARRIRYSRRHLDRAVRADSHPNAASGRTCRLPHARRDEYDCPARCARCAVNQADLQRCHQSSRRAHRAASRGRDALPADRRVV